MTNKGTTSLTSQISCQLNLHVVHNSRELSWLGTVTTMELSPIVTMISHEKLLVSFFVHQILTKCTVFQVYIEKSCIYSVPENKIAWLHNWCKKHQNQKNLCYKASRNLHIYIRSGLDQTQSKCLQTEATYAIGLE